MQNSMVVFTFLVFDWKYLLWASLVQNLVPRLNLNIQNSMVLFRLDIPFLGKFGLKNQNGQFKLKLGT